MSWISALLTLTAVWALGRVDVLQAFFIGIIAFGASLAISRLFDLVIFRITSRIVKRLSEHKRLKFYFKESRNNLELDNGAKNMFTSSDFSSPLLDT